MSIDRAQTLRTNPTAAEKRLWRLLYPFRTDGYHFRKQTEIWPYYADFACHHALLVTEADGDTHGTATGQMHDAARDAYLRERGYTILRFSNWDILGNPEGVYSTISEALKGRPKNIRSAQKAPSPALPARGRVPAGDLAPAVPQTRSDTLPLAGRAGEGDGSV